MRQNLRKTALNNLDTTAMETQITRNNLKQAWARRFGLTEDEREQLAACAFEEWGTQWRTRISEPCA